MPHFIKTMRVWQRIIGLAKVPFPGEECVVARRLKNRRQRPFFGRETASLTLKGDSRHAAAVRNTACYHRGTARCAAWLGIEREECHSLACHAVEIRGRHPTPLTAAIRTEITVANIIPYYQNDVRLARSLSSCLSHSLYSSKESWSADAGRMVTDPAAEAARVWASGHSVV